MNPESFSLKKGARGVKLRVGWCIQTAKCPLPLPSDLKACSSLPAGGTGRMAVVIVRIGISPGGQDFGQPILNVQLELGGDLRHMNAEGSAHMLGGKPLDAFVSELSNRLLKPMDFVRSGGFTMSRLPL